jgi:hypothetical protein
MRPRFRLRMLLILTAVAAAVCYWWVARPTIVANRFIAAYNASDSATIDQMWVGPPPTDFQYYVSGHVQPKFRLVPELLPRSFHDVRTATRRIAFHWTFDGGPVRLDLNVVTPLPVIAGPRGIHSPAATDDDEFGVEFNGPVFFDRTQLIAPAK